MRSLTLVKYAWARQDSQEAQRRHEWLADANVPHGKERSRILIENLDSEYSHIKPCHMSLWTSTPLEVHLWCQLNTIVTHATAIVCDQHCDCANKNCFLARKCQTLVFKLFQSWVSDMQHKAEDSVLLVVFDAFCKRGHSMSAVVGDHAVRCLQHVQHCCIQCACI